MLSRRRFMVAGANAAAGMAVGPLLAGCGHQTAATNSPYVYTPTLDITKDGSLKAHAATVNLLTGCAVVPWLLKSDHEYRRLVVDQCSIMVPENALKWEALRPTPDEYNFTDADELVSFAEKNDIKLRGHNLVWHEALPKWFDGAVFKGNARQAMIDHIMQVAGRYSGRMHSWDVVNEAIDPYSDRMDGLRASPWLQLAGDDYIELAFRTARQADSGALLTYNDYGIECDTFEADKKRAAMLMMLRRLKARNVPIDAVGIQSHLSARGPKFGQGVKSFIADVRKMGLQVFITEMDVSDAALELDPAHRDQVVAGVYNEYLTDVLADKAVTAVLTWGITDRYTWLAQHTPRKDGEAQRCLPFDTNYRPKSAFFAMREAYDSRTTAPQGPDPNVNPYAPFKPGSSPPVEAVKPAASKT